MQPTGSDHTTFKWVHVQIADYDCAAMSDSFLRLTDELPQLRRHKNLVFRLSPEFAREVHRDHKKTFPQGHTIVPNRHLNCRGRGIAGPPGNG